MAKFIKVGKFKEVFDPTIYCEDDEQIKSFFNYNFIQ